MSRTFGCWRSGAYAMRRALMTIGSALSLAHPSVLSAQVNVSTTTSASPSRVNAAEVLARPVTVHLNQTRLDEAVRKIAAEAHVRVQYADDVFDGSTTRVTLQV